MFHNSIRGHHPVIPTALTCNPSINLHAQLGYSLYVQLPSYRSKAWKLRSALCSQPSLIEYWHPLGTWTGDLRVHSADPPLLLTQVHWLKTFNHLPHSSALAQFPFTVDMKSFGREVMVVYCNGTETKIASSVYSIAKVWVICMLFLQINTGTQPVISYNYIVW